MIKDLFNIAGFRLPDKTDVAEERENVKKFSKFQHLKSNILT
jgi:hypothetical protein